MSAIRSVRVGVTLNLGNYQSLRLEVEVEADQEHESAEALFARARAEIAAERARLSGAPDATDCSDLAHSVEARAR